MAYIVNSHRQFQPKVINYCLHLIKCRILYTRIQEHPSINPLYCILIPPIASLLVTKYRRPACSKQHTALSCVRHPVNSQKQQPVGVGWRVERPVARNARPAMTQNECLPESGYCTARRRGGATLCLQLISAGQASP